MPTVEGTAGSGGRTTLGLGMSLVPSGSGVIGKLWVPSTSCMRTPCALIRRYHFSYTSHTECRVAAARKPSATGPTPSGTLVWCMSTILDRTSAGRVSSCE